MDKRRLTDMHKLVLGFLLPLSQGCNMATLHTEASTESAVGVVMIEAKKHTGWPLHVHVPFGICRNCSGMNFTTAVFPTHCLSTLPIDCQRMDVTYR